MSKRVSIIVLTVVLTGFMYVMLPVHMQGEASKSQDQVHRFPDARDKHTDGWTGPVFKLSQDYPTQPPPEEKYPWQQYDFKAEWIKYLLAVRDYCYEGNINDDVDWVVQKNKARSWFHAPWLHWGRNGREFVHGLTHERVSQPEELSRAQTSRFQNWAVSVYNAPGGYVIGQVWRNPLAPVPSAARFPEGTVSVKILFTQATVEQVPYLKGSKEWQAHIYKEIVSPTNPLTPREIQTLRLLQLDVAVRDSRSPTGWVFGTFVYNGDAPGDTPWKRMVPIGLMWGNDPGVTVAMVRNGRKLQETVLNFSPDVPFQHLGWAGRLNGPVDNPISSCISCHSVSQWPPDPDTLLVPPRKTRDGKIIEPDSELWMKWFRNIKAEEPFTPDTERTSLGYSLQLMAGLQNFSEWQELIKERGRAINSPSAIRAFDLDSAVRYFGALRHKYFVSREGIADKPNKP